MAGLSDRSIHGVMRYIRAALFAVIASACAYAQSPDPAPGAKGDNPPGPTETLTITSGGKTQTFQVEVANTPEKTSKGLMWRKEMPKDHGMIFDFGSPRPIGMYMRNTLIPLDMLFIAADGKILAIAKNARPQSERIIDPGVPVRGVLEINGGAAEQFGIQPGDVVSYKIFGTRASTSGEKGDSAKGKKRGG